MMAPYLQDALLQVYKFVRVVFEEVLDVRYESLPWGEEHLSSSVCLEHRSKR